jgi:hypothetical protein
MRMGPEGAALTAEASGRVSQFENATLREFGIVQGR